MAEKKKRFKLFDMNRDGPGVSKDEAPLTPTFLHLPKFYFRKFTKLLSVNMLMTPLFIIPLIMVYLYVVAPTTPTESHVLYSTLYGSYLLTSSPAWTSLLGVYGIQLNMPVFDPLRIWVMIGLFLLLGAVWGWINVGATYCCRSLFRGEPVFVLDDFKYSIRRNLKQGFFVGLIDYGCLALLAYDMVYFSRRGGTFWLDFMFFALCAVTAVFLFMRMYFYVMLITFDIKTGKLLKNSLIFSILGIKRNLLAALSILIVAGLNAVLIILFYPINVFVPIMLPFIYLLPTVCMFKVYFTYPVLEKYMIKRS
jgi:hypothetical protein